MHSYVRLAMKENCYMSDLHIVDAVVFLFSQMIGVVGCRYLGSGVNLDNRSVSRTNKLFLVNINGFFHYSAWISSLNGYKIALIELNLVINSLCIFFQAVEDDGQNPDEFELETSFVGVATPKQSRSEYSLD